ncbi:MAG: hypothetical protein LBE21_08080 [Pseudomonadales bacterium]|jgi:hypothetical protein|nr:hypothetical protein [Pseudomonadales bacterium]
MLQRLTRALCGVFLLVLTSPSFAIVSMCSGEALPQSGVDAVRHEVFWDDFDVWFADTNLEMYTLVEGAATFDKEASYPLGQGGSALHVAPIPAAGQYTVSGYASIAYPEAWGLDGGFGSACNPWIGTLNEALADEELSDAGDVKQDVEQEDNNAATLVCLSADGSSCVNEGSTPPVIAPEPPDGVLPRPPARSSQALSVMRGLVYAFDDTGLVLQTPSGQYLTYYFSEDYTITRHTVVPMSALEAGDAISVATQRDAAGVLEAVRVFAYRDPRQDQPLAVAPGTAALDAGVPVSGLLQMLSAQPERGGELRMKQGERELTLKFSPLLDATVIRPASFADIGAVPGYVQVIGAALDDGTQTVRALELHW